MKNIWGKYKNILVLILYVGCMTLIFYLVVIPLDADIKNKKKYAEELAIDKDVYEKKIKEVPLLRDKAELIRRSEGELDVFIDPKNALPVIESIEKLANDTGVSVTIKIIDDGSTKGAGGTKENKVKEPTGIWADVPSKTYISTKLDVVGEFNAIFKFISKMEKFSYFSDIVSLKIVKKQEVKGVEQNILRRTAGSFGALSSPESNQIADTGKDIVAGEAINQLEASLEIIFYTQE